MPLATPNRGPEKRWRCLCHFAKKHGAHPNLIRSMATCLRSPEMGQAPEADALLALLDMPQAFVGSTIPFPRVEQTWMNAKPTICACPGWVADEPTPPQTAPEVVYENDFYRVYATGTKQRKNP